MSPPSAPAGVNRRIVLAAHPRGEPLPSDFRMEVVPRERPADGEVLLQTLWLSLDPYMRGMMNETHAYRRPVALGEVMVGETVSRVVESRHPEFHAGDLVVAGSGWQEYQVASGHTLRRLPPDMPQPRYGIGVLGMPGFTAYHGLLNLGRPRAGETLVLAASTGAVGSIVGQLGKSKGCRVVGIAGGPEKCAYAVEELGYDAAVDHRDPRMPELLAEACPAGIDVYFENVGGAVFQAVLPLLNVRSRVPVCGVIAQYSAKEPPSGPDRLPLLERTILTKRVRMEGFIISDHYVEDGIDNRTRWFEELSRWVDEGRIRYREDIAEGLETAPAAFIGMLAGRNFGKALVRIAG